MLGAALGLGLRFVSMPQVMAPAAVGIAVAAAVIVILQLSLSRKAGGAGKGPPSRLVRKPRGGEMKQPTPRHDSKEIGRRPTNRVRRNPPSS